MEKLFLFAILSWITGSPLIALLAILLLGGAGYGYLSGRLFGLSRAWARWRGIRELRRTVAANPHDATARNDLGRLLVEAGRAQEALPHLEAAVRRMPDIPETLYHLGAARLKTGDAAGGRALVERALGLDPKLGYGEPHLLLGDDYFQNGQAELAVHHLEFLTALHSSTVEGRYKLARAHLAAGRSDQARAAVDDAIAVYRRSPAFRRRQERLWRWRAAWLRRQLGPAGGKP